jgi:hypothetical protein
MAVPLACGRDSHAASNLEPGSYPSSFGTHLNLTMESELNLNFKFGYESEFGFDIGYKSA